MTKVVAAALLLLGTSAAYAEAPGEWSQPPAASYYPAEPVAVVVAPPVEVDWRNHRFAVGVSLGTMGVGGQYDDEGTSFDVSELAVRWRASRRLELELVAGGGRETYSEGYDNDLAMGNFVADVRFRFRPDHRWGWYALAGFGGTVIASHTANADERDRQTRGMFVSGIGADVRLSRRWSLQAEVRGYSIGPTTESEDQLNYGTGTDSGMDGPTEPSPPPNPRRTADSEALGGGQFTLGASLYF